MRRITAGFSAVAAFALLPGTALADEPTKTDRQNASKQCSEQRSGMGVAAFRELYGTNKTKRNAFGKCVSKFAKDEMRERKAARANAAKDCKAEQSDPDFTATHEDKTFVEFYGANRTGKNAYGRCVAQKAKENKEEADAADARKDEVTINAARQCRAEQKEMGKDAFKDEYGTNRTKRNAFGKCVSQESRDSQES